MCSTLKSQENIQKAYMERETETEIKYFIKEKKRKREIYSRRKKIWPFCIFFVNSDTGMNQKTFISS
jgi:hypothetical protein